MRATSLLLTTFVIGGLSGADIGDAFLAFSPEIRPFAIAVNGSAQIEPAARLDNGDGDYAREVWRVGARAQVWRDARDELVVNGGWNESLAQTRATLPTLGEFPDRLYDARVGAQFRRVDPDQRVYGASLSLGSADSDPFASGDALNVAASLFLRYPLRRDALLVSLFYTNDATVLNDVPIPGLVYEWKPQRRFTAWLGFPFCAARAALSERLSMDAAATVFGTAHLGTAYALGSPRAPRLTAAVDYGTETWKWPDELDHDQRVYFRGGRATAGVAWDRGPLLGASLAGGYAFARQVLIGESIRDWDDRLDLPAGAIIALSARAGF